MTCFVFLLLTTFSVKKQKVNQIIDVYVAAPKVCQSPIKLKKRERESYLDVVVNTNNIIDSLSNK